MKCVCVSLGGRTETSCLNQGHKLQLELFGINQHDVMKEVTGFSFSFVVVLYAVATLTVTMARSTFKQEGLLHFLSAQAPQTYDARFD